MRSLSRIHTYLAMTLCASLLLIGACGGGEEIGNLPNVDCDAVTVPTFSQLTILEVCTACHSSTLEGNNRGSVPVGVDFDIYELASEHAEHGASEVYEGRMPPPGFANVAAQERQDFYAWALCGTPQ